jgi:enoyl-CoA hydratase
VVAQLKTRKGNPMATDVLIEQQLVAGGEKLVVTLNRPDKSNTLTRAMLDELNHALDEAEREDAIRVVLLSASGLEGFSAGLDHAEMQNENGVSAASRALVAYMCATARRIEMSKKPVISLVHGQCTGAGTRIALSADFVIAANDAKISEPQFKMGGFASDDWLRHIGHVLGPMRAKTYVVMAQVLSGKEAEALGLVSLSVPEEELRATGHHLADDLCKHPAKEVVRTLRLIDEGAFGAWHAVRH